ncbi:elongation factor 1-beta-like isoform X2 [Paramacrobiotus metropolitanus]|uniref:elongation factor 1-beta-like isoform X2 n=1 Tax=Paramacrobiotus metropolitanus TaxID=2943436 RepID=UPI002445A766|nr:elongation factor 1-beta-like isoform X2 [Paramacrobiotus metropolitanus]
MVHSILNEKSSLNVPAILKAEQEYHEAKALIDSIDKMPAALDKLNAVDSEVKELRKEIEQLSKHVIGALGKLEARLNGLSLAPASGATQDSTHAKKVAGDADKKETTEKKDNDDIDLFGSDEEEEDPEAIKRREERLAAYEAKKAKKPALIAKSMIILDVKPWDDETDVKEMETKVRSIQTDGLIWGTSKFVEVAYGIKKLQITCVVEDDKVGTDYLEEQITGFEDLVQSVDIVAFNKI